MFAIMSECIVLTHIQACALHFHLSYNRMCSSLSSLLLVVFFMSHGVDGLALDHSRDRTECIDRGQVALTLLPFVLHISLLRGAADTLLTWQPSC